MNIQALMRQAQTLQKEMVTAKDELNNTEFIGESELVTVVLKGDRKVSSIKFKNMDDFDPSDIEIIEDMIVIAMNDAFKKIDKAYEEKLGKYGNAIPSFF